MPVETNIAFPASKYATAEELTKAQIAAVNEWQNAGATKDFVQYGFSLANADTSADYAAKVAAQNDDIFIGALYVSNWQSIPSLATIVGNIRNNHVNNLNLYLITSNYDGSEPQDKEPYRRQDDFISVVREKKGTDTWSITSEQSQSDNSSENRASELTKNAIDLTDIFVQTTWTLQSGNWVIANEEKVSD